MKKQLVSTSFLAIFTAGAFILSLTSCSKSPNPNAQFVGTYGGQSNYGNVGTPNADTLVITAGSTASAISILETLDNTTFAATVSGDSIIISSQSTTLKGNGNAGVSVAAGSGQLSGSKISLGVVGTYTSGAGNFTFNFQGSK